MAEGTGEISVQKRVEPSGHSATGAIKSRCCFERAGRKDLGGVGVNDAHGDASGESHAADNPETCFAPARPRRLGGWRGSVLVCRIDGVRQHSCKCRAGLARVDCRCLVFGA